MPSEPPPDSPIIPYARQSIDEADIKAVVDALKSEFVTQGPRLQWFEDGLREVTGARYAVAVSSGTAALHLACLGLDIGDGAAGIVPAITFAATANCLKYCRAGVQFCDVDSRSGIAGPEHFEAAISQASERSGKPRLLLPVSFTGKVGDLEGIASVASRNDCYVVEDAAHSIGGFYRRSDGSVEQSAACSDSDAAILSFHPVKQVCAAEGGAILTNDRTLAERARRLRSHGIVRAPENGSDWEYAQLELGYNYRMTELQAALGYSQLGKLEDFVGKRKAIAQRYCEAFEDEALKSVFACTNFDEASAWHLFVVRFRDSKLRQDAFRFLRSKGILCQVHYMPVYRHPYYKEICGSSFEGAENFYSRCLSLPMYPALREQDQLRVIQSLGAFCRSI